MHKNFSGFLNIFCSELLNNLSIKSIIQHRAKTKQIKLFRNTLEETSFISQLRNAKTEQEIKVLVENFRKEYKAIFDSNPVASEEFIKIIKQQISVLRSQQRTMGYA